MQGDDVHDDPLVQGDHDHDDPLVKSWLQHMVKKAL